MDPLLVGGFFSGFVGGFVAILVGMNYFVYSGIL